MNVRCARSADGLRHLATASLRARLSGAARYRAAAWHHHGIAA